MKPTHGKRRPRALAALTLAEVRSLKLEPLAALATGLGLRTIRRRIGSGHGNTQLGNLLDDVWPVTPEQLGGLTVAFARDANMSGEIAIAAGLTAPTVWRRLGSCAGQMLLGNAFPEFDTETVEESDDLEEISPEEAHAAIVAAEKDELIIDLGLLSCHAVRGEGPVIRLLSGALGTSERAVRWRLRRVHGRTLVENAFADWPETAVTLTIRPDALGGLLSSVALKSPLTLHLICHLLEKTAWEIRLAIENGGPRSRVGEALAKAWPAVQGSPVTNPAHEFDGLQELLNAMGGG